jgi:hypothetical protein
MLADFSPFAGFSVRAIANSLSIKPQSPYSARHL